MLTLPDNLSPDDFLQQYWQKQALFMPAALDRLRPSLSRNELGWLATHDDVESRIVFVDRNGSTPRYRVETGPFDVDYLVNLPKRDWTLLVHDVDKHVPAIQALFKHVPFIPDWRIDDLMVSFAAPGGGVGPHRDQYDVFLCQGIGVRSWTYSGDEIDNDERASDDLALLNEFNGSSISTREGDVLYIPPGSAHWGVAERACMTYSIGMRAPQKRDFAALLRDTDTNEEHFFQDPDLRAGEAIPGHIGVASIERAATMMGASAAQMDDVALALGLFATQPKEWLQPEIPKGAEAKLLLERWARGSRLSLHGMAQIAYDDRNVYLNGKHAALTASSSATIAKLCAEKYLRKNQASDADTKTCFNWLLNNGAFEIPAIS